MTMSVYLSVCPLRQLENHTAKSHQIFVHDAYGHGSILLWRCRDTLCTSGFVDDIMGSVVVRHVYS